MFFIFNSDEHAKPYESALQILFESNYEKVYRTVMAITLDKDLAKDITQEAFLKAFTRIDTLKDKSKFSQWVCAIAVNVCRDMLRNKIVHRNKNISLYDEDGNIRDNIIKFMEIDGPEKIYEDNEIKQRIKSYVKELDTEERQIIIMKYYNKLSFAEISEQIKIKEGTLRVKALRAREKIVNKIRQFLDVEENGING